jgi:hypothetical protein
MPCLLVFIILNASPSLYFSSILPHRTKLLYCFAPKYFGEIQMSSVILSTSPRASLLYIKRSETITPLKLSHLAEKMAKTSDDDDSSACWQQNYPTSNQPQTTEINNVYPATVPLQGESKTSHQKTNSPTSNITIKQSNIKPGVSFFNTKIIADDNHNRLLALATLELVRHHNDLRMIKLKTHIHDLTFELANVCNERDQSRAEMVRLNIIGPDFGMTRYSRVHPHHPINHNRLEEEVVGAQEVKQLVADYHSFDLGMENRFLAINIFALTMDIKQSTIHIIELMSHINELTSEIANVTSERDQFCAAIENFNNGIIGWGRFRLH